MPEVVEVAEDVVAAGLVDWVPSAEELFPTKAAGELAGLRDPKAKELSGTTPNLEVPASENESVWADSLAGAVSWRNRSYKLNYGIQNSFIILTIIACFSVSQIVRQCSCLKTIKPLTIR